VDPEDNEDHDGRDAGHPGEKEQPARARDIGNRGGVGDLSVQLLRGPGARLVTLEPVELFTTHGALADVDFDRRQLGQANPALEEEREAFAGVLARHDRHRSLSPKPAGARATM